MNDGWRLRGQAAYDTAVAKETLAVELVRVGRALKRRSPKIPSTRLWHPLNVPLPRALPGRSLAELGFLIPSKLPQGSLEPRHSAPSARELQHG